MVDWLGRRLTACVCLAGACGAALLFAFAPADPVWSVAAACIFNGISVGGWNALDLLSAELFATEARSTAMGLLGAFGRLASFTTTFLAGRLMGGCQGSGRGGGWRGGSAAWLCGQGIWEGEVSLVFKHQHDSVGGWNALDLLSAELFATEVRSTAMGLLGAFGRHASFITTFLAGRAH